jgi:alpha-N-arabinofuranosidase
MRTHKKFRAALIVAFGVFQIADAQVSPESLGCAPAAVVRSAREYSLVVDERQPARKMPETFFGFNLEWVEFERSLYDTTARRVRPDVIEWLRPFAGAVYRYPGGVTPNHTQWRDTIGEVGTRPPRKYVDWLGPIAPRFGLDEYLRFVREVDGRAWYIANTRGNTEGEQPLQFLAEDAGRLVSYLAGKQSEGAPRVLRWELGNELDRDRFRWPADKLARHSEPVSREIHRTDRDAKTVILLQEYPVQGSSARYNRSLVSALKGEVDEYALHLYHDGKPGGRPIPTQIKAVCDAINDVRAANPGKAPVFWITETARVPEGAFVTPDWKPLWPQTANLQAAISVADMLIAIAQVPEVQGAFVHALHGLDGPWPLFHRSRGGGLHPSAVFWGLKLLRESVLPEILRTYSSGPSRSGYDGGYDVRGLVMADNQRKKISVWLVNRSDSEASVRVNIPILAGKGLVGQKSTLFDEQLLANNYLDGSRVKPIVQAINIRVDQSGAANLVVSPHSVSSFVASVLD